MYAVIALISAAALALEILLMRLFSIVQWHHFAYMIISVALLGFAASGTFVALRYARARADMVRAIPLHAACCAICVPLTFFAAQAVPFNPLAIIWDPGQWLHLFVIYLLLLLPFFFASNCICIAIASGQRRVGWIYGADLIGAAAGALGILALLWLVHPGDALLIVSSLAGLAAVVASLRFAPVPESGRAAVAAAVLVTALVAVFTPLRSVTPSQYKLLPQTLRMPGSRVLGEYYSPAGLITVVRSGDIPFRQVPGLSLNTDVPLPEQLGAFVDADALAAITRYQAGRTDLRYLEGVPEALPYELLHHPRVLLLGSGAGAGILQALHYGAQRIDAVESNRRMVDLLRGPYAGYSGELFARPDVHLHISEGRSFVARTASRYALVMMPLFDAFGSGGGGLQAIQEDYLHTVEALSAFMDILEPGGVLAIAGWVQVPPREGIKLFATAVAALERRGVTDPGKAMAWIRGWQTQLLLVKRGEFTAQEIGHIREFAESRWFDLAYLPGLSRDHANRFNVLRQAYFYDAARAILGPARERFFDSYKFQIRPATDGRPFFHHFFKWHLLAELLAMPAGQGWAFMDLAYPIVLATLLQALLAGVVLVLSPLLVFRRRFHFAEHSPRRVLLAVGGYCLLVGFAFMFTEIAAIQRFTLYLGEPIYAAAGVIAAFLVFAGTGSALYGRRERACRLPLVGVLIAGIPTIAVLLWSSLPAIFDATLAAPFALRLLITIAVLAPLAVLMGIPLPAALSRIRDREAGLAAWAWGANGFASVIGAVLATLLAIHWGNDALLGAAALLYLLAAATLMIPRVFGAR